MTDSKKTDSLEAADLDKVNGGFGWYGRGWGGGYGGNPYAMMERAMFTRMAMDYAYGPRPAYYGYGYGPRPAYYWYNY